MNPPRLSTGRLMIVVALALALPAGIVELANRFPAQAGEGHAW
jgi:hypothetical protein